MHETRIAELLEPFLEANDKRLTANDALYRNISTYIDILLRWNAHINLTAIRDPEDIVTRHFGESLFAARHLFPSGAHVGTTAAGCPAERSSAAAGLANGQRPTTNDVRAADIGSGAGFPGLPIKLWAPDIALTLIESNHKKATFLREVTRALTLTDVNILNIRAQDPIKDFPITDPFDVVTLRAVERFEDTLPIAATLATSGRLALLIGASQLDQARSKLPTFTWQPPIAVPKSRSRTLLIGQRNRSLDEG